MPQILTNNQFRKMIKDKKIKVILESTEQNYKKEVTYGTPPKIKLSCYRVQFGSKAEGQILFSPPAQSINQNENIIIIQTTQENCKWTIEIMDAAN